jgi:ribonuclease III
MISLQEIETLVGTKINNISLYIQAFTHKSFNKDVHYERLEFIGDAVIKFVVTKYLYEKFPNEDEGFLTRARTKIERSETLAAFSRSLLFNTYIMMDEKALRNEWNNNDKILEDVFEAFVGAIYQDKGLVYARDFILNILERYTVSFIDDNYKDMLMRYCQAQKIQNPLYIEVQTRDVFRSIVFIEGVQKGMGYGKTKRQSQQEAAKDAIKTHNIFIPNHASKSR